MRPQTKIVSSQGTVYLERFPLTPKLRALSIPVSIIAGILFAIFIYMATSGMADTYNNVFYMTAYMCAYLSILGALSGITVSRPPSVFLSITLYILCGVITIYFAFTLLALWSIFPESSAVYHATVGKISPDAMLITTFFVFMFIRPMLLRWSRVIKKSLHEPNY